MWEQTIQLVFDDWIVNFISPSKRLFWGYLLSAFILAILWLWFVRKERFKSAIHTVFNKTVWLSASSLTDYVILSLNTILMTAIFPRLLGSTAVSYLIFELLHELLSGRSVIAASMPGWVIASAFTTVLFVIDDFARYIVHRLLHTIPVLWAFHKVHHSATSLNPLTVLRTHPVESIIFLVRGAVVQGICIGFFVYFFDDRVSLLMVLGANVFKFTFNFMGANLRHSEIPLGYCSWLERVLLSPAQHQIHHSVNPEHYDKNFGVVLAIWDIVFQSHCHSKREQKLQYGLTNSSNYSQNAFKLYWVPFREVGLLLRNKVSNRLQSSSSPLTESTEQTSP